MRYDLRTDSATALKPATAFPTAPGIYCFLDAANTPIYVGKARNLKARLANYFGEVDNAKTRLMMANAHAVELTITRTEKEALLLELNLIKTHSPRFNVLFRDDKTYPYIYVSDHAFPRIRAHRGAQKGKGHYFGPFPNAHSVHATIHIFQKVFQVRTCSDSFFAHRTRPCLQHQIKRCTAPCVGKISDADYQQDVQAVRDFLAGKDVALIDKLAARMQAASSALAFETAARLRDQIEMLQSVREQQRVENTEIRIDADIIAVARHQEACCVQMGLVRGGRFLGSKTMRMAGARAGATDGELLEAFISQYYQGQQVLPAELILSGTPDNQDLLHAVLPRTPRVIFRTNPGKVRRAWLDMVRHNANEFLTREVAKNARTTERLAALANAFPMLTAPFRRIECFDISHTMGNQARASCVVFVDGVAETRFYRLYTLDGITPGDDYAAMREVLLRRYAKAPLPDLLLIDGGKGQANMAKAALAELAIETAPVVSIAKGEGRKPGLERFFLPYLDNAMVDLPADNIGFHLLQQVRDEAHRFAISGHRRARAKQTLGSALDDIPGVGRTTKQRLIQHFGGINNVKKASTADLARVKGVSAKLATTIHDFFHDTP